MTQKASIVGVLASIAAATGVSFTVAALLMKTQSTSEEDGDEAALEKATSQMKDMKSATKSNSAVSAQNKGNIDLADVKSIIVACDAGMGSSAMGASMLRKRYKMQV